MNTPDKPYWQDAVETEHKKFVQNCVQEPRDKNTLPPDAKIISSTWAMKKKSDGTCHARLNEKVFEQQYSVNYTKDDVLETLVNGITIWIVLILFIMAAWWE